MDLRDHFAAEAMAVLLKTEPAIRTLDDIAKKAYAMADAMLAARNTKA